MQKDSIDELFDKLKGEFDINEPNKDHELRFLNKLKAYDVVANDTEKSVGFNWKPFLAIAASVILCLSVFITLQNEPKS